MEQAMTPSKTMTAGQIDKAVSLYRAMLEKHAPQFEAGPVQRVLGQEELAGDMFGLFRGRVETESTIITRTVKVNRVRTPKEAIAATGRAPYIDQDVLAAMSRGEGDEVTVYFIKFGKSLSPSDLEQEVDRAGYRLADVYSAVAVSEADKAFADGYPYAMQCRDSDGKPCYAGFGRWGGERGVGVGRSEAEWDAGWSFACFRK